jgi:YD repeat-containing protein
MRSALTLSFLLTILYSSAQYTPQEIKKFRISKITKLTVTKGDETTQRNEVYFDANGYDTAEYNGADLYCRTTYQLNANGQVMSRTRYKPDGKEIETATFNYKPDGSLVISNTDKDFGMTELTYCNRSGKVVMTKSPDGTERNYSYDSKGKLARVRSKPNNGGVVTDLQYSYNEKGQLLKEQSKGDYKWTNIYSYNSKGLISKIKRTSISDGVADPEVTITYEYEFIQ